MSAVLTKLNRADRYSKAEWRNAKWELWLWQHSTTASHFSVELYRLIAKADIENKLRLHMAYPCFVDCFHEWQERDPAEFFADVLRPVIKF